MSNTRRMGQARYPRQAATRDTEEPIPCTYCGMPASTKDHVVPLSLLANIEGLGDDLRDEILKKLPKLIAVYACNQCNRVLGNRFFRTITGRRAAVKDYLREKYARVLHQPDWAESEIEELGYGLQDFVRRRKELKRVVIERLKWRT